jgi:hypothetical protein
LATRKEDMSISGVLPIDLTLDVGYSRFKIIFDKHMQEKESLFGETDFDKHIIRIQTGLNEFVEKEIFWHELTHVLAELSGFGGHPEDEDTKSELPSVTNEELVTRMSRSIILLFRLNPWLKDRI